MLQDPDTAAWVGASQSSNPFRPYLGEQPVWTTNFVDSLGRTTKVRTPDNAIVRTNYSGSSVTVSDQTNRQRKSISDALGRLKEVYEDPTVRNYLTSYDYDVLDNLTKVTQGTQTPREFAYDSLKRLTSAMNPESGTISYQYDNNGNLTQKTDARGVTSTYLYDALNRNTNVSYSDGTIAIVRVYDNTTNGKGRLSWQYKTNWTNVGTLESFNYDALGRITNQNQQYMVNSSWTPTSPYTINRSYDLAGHVTSQTYPSGNSVSYSYDGAGRTNSFAGNLGGTQLNYAMGIIYSPLGAVTKEQFGTDTTPLYNKSFYNSRGQLSDIRVSTSYTGPTDFTWNRGAILNQYSLQCSGPTCNATDNNGNLRKQEVWVPTNDQAVTWFQQYDYDSLNRLQGCMNIPIRRRNYGSRNTCMTVGAIAPFTRRTPGGQLRGRSFPNQTLVWIQQIITG